MSTIATMVPEIGMFVQGWVGVDSAPLLQLAKSELAAAGLDEAIQNPSSSELENNPFAAMSMNQSGPLVTQIGNLDPSGEAFTYLDIERIDDENLQEVVGRAAEEISGGLERAFAYIKGGENEGQLDAIVLSGGGAQMPLLRKHLSQRHDVPVEVLDPLRTISYDPELFAEQPVEELAPLLTVPVGLGLRRVE